MNVHFISMDLPYIKNIFLSITVPNLFSFNSIYFISNKKKKRVVFRKQHIYLLKQTRLPHTEVRLYVKGTSTLYIQRKPY